MTKHALLSLSCAGLVSGATLFGLASGCSESREREADVSSDSTAVSSTAVQGEMDTLPDDLKRSTKMESSKAENVDSGQDKSTAIEPNAEGKVVLSAAEWKARLNRDEYRILRRKGTERAFTGDLWDNKKTGMYVCRGCGNELFHSDTKFDSGTGWPSYYAPVAEGKVSTEEDNSLFMRRTEVLCARCNGHLGHVFPDGPAPTNLRYCINSASLDFVEEGVN